MSRLATFVLEQTNAGGLAVQRSAFPLAPAGGLAWRGWAAQKYGLPVLPHIFTPTRRGARSRRCTESVDFSRVPGCFQEC